MALSKTLTPLFFSMAILLIGDAVDVNSHNLRKLACAAQSNAASSSFELIARTDYEVVEAGEPVVITVLLKNTSDRALNLIPNSNDPSPAPSFFKVVITNQQGQVSPDTRYGMKLNNLKMPGSSLPMIPRKVAPGEQVRENLVVSRLADMTDAGTYWVVIKPNIFPRDDRLSVAAASYPVQVKVVERDISPFIQVPAPSQAPGSQSPAIDAQSTISPTLSWRAGDSWVLAVDHYFTNVPDALPPQQLKSLGKAREPSNTPKDIAARILKGSEEARQEELPYLMVRYKMLVQVVGTEKVEDRECWQVQFLPTESAPSSVKAGACRVLIGKEDGLICQVSKLQGPNSRRLEKIDGILLPTNLPLGYPVELFGLQNVEKADDRPHSNHWHLKVDQQSSVEGRTVKVNLRRGDQTEISVQQQWMPNARWWSRYEKVDAQHQVILRARKIEGP